MAKSNFIVRGGGDFSGLYKEFDKAQKKMNAFQKGIQKSLRTLGTIIGTIAIGKLVKDSTKAAMDVESSIAQLSRIMGDNAAVFDDWAKAQAKAFGMAREEAYQYGAIYGNLISTFARDTQETTRYTTELLKASAVVASATGRTMEDTMERIRSGLLGNTEAIEDLGINVNVAMLESTEAFRKFANGRSWQQLTFQEQQQIRLMAILEQANLKYGDSLAGTTATNQMMFLATLKNIRLNIGQAFLPIYNTVLPLLTALATKLEQVTSAFAQFTQVLFGKSATVQKTQTKNTQAQAGAVAELGDATEEAGKQAKGALAGFDEINQLDMTQGGGVSGGGLAGGAAVDPVLTENDSKTGGLMEDVSTKAVEMGKKVETAFVKMKNAIVENKGIIIPAIGAITGALAGLAVVSMVSTLAGKFKTLRLAVKGVWAILLANPVLLVAAAIGALIGTLIAAYLNNDKFRESVDELWARIKTALTPAIQKLGDVLFWLWMSVISPIAAIVKDVLTVAFNLLTTTIMWLWQYVLVPVGIFIANSLGPVFVKIASIITGIVRVAIEGLIKVFQFLWYEVLKPITLWLIDTFKPVFEAVGEAVKIIIKGIQITFDGLIKFITGVFTDNWKLAWEGVRAIFKGIFDSLYGIVKVPLNLIIDAINTVIGGLNKISIDVPKWVPKYGGKSWGINIPKIPKLAKGGITNGPMIAMIGDNPGGREVVSPLDDLTDIIVSAVGTAVMSAMQIAGRQNNSNSSGDIVLKVDGTTLARIINPYLAREQNRVGNTIISTT